jgi:predicted RNA-binding protein with PUA-like domain
VRNPEARKHLGAMAVGDLVLFYHSGAPKAVVGVAKVTKAAYPEPGAEGWLAVDLAPVVPFAEPVSLAAVKAERALAKIALVTRARLSVMPIEAAAFDRILALGRTRIPAR